VPPIRALRVHSGEPVFRSKLPAAFRLTENPERECPRGSRVVGRRQRVSRVPSGRGGFSVSRESDRRARLIRVQGGGIRLLNEATAIAKQLQCEGLRLCTGLDRIDAHLFYEREGWTRGSFALKVRL